MHSLSEENYLKAIYGLSQKNDKKVSLTAIAEHLGNNPVSVIDMLRKLTEKKLISYDKKKGARLTERGCKAAIGVVRRHRLWEAFLCEKLGYGWEEVHDIAEQLEHVHDEELADRLDKFLGYPEFDPHGDPIPKANGRMANPPKTLLSNVAVGKSCRVAAVKDTTVEFLQYLGKLSIQIGTPLKVIDKIAFDDSIVIQITKSKNTTISKKFGESILVEE